MFHCLSASALELNTLGIQELLHLNQHRIILIILNTLRIGNVVLFDNLIIYQPTYSDKFLFDARF